MDNNRAHINELITKVYKKLLAQLGYDEIGMLRLIDPNEQCEISAHYGASHFAASLLMIGNEDDTAYARGKELLQSILARWNQENKLPAYHYDFNNFAFLLCYANLKDVDSDLKEFVRQTIIQSPDSNHNTINWLPMRMLVNDMRFKWTGEEKYKQNISNCIKLIYNATNSDGGIEDRLPKGVSFNLQYDISSFATLIYAKEMIPDYDFGKGLRFLLESIAPDGDINYQGRGCNQIFAWGPWIYILSVCGQAKELAIALDFMDKYLPRMLENNSMMLNDWPGSEKYLWWDYHYASVYTAHLLLWLLLAKLNYADRSLSKLSGCDAPRSSGVNIHKSDDYFISIFNGRNEYLAEKGPSLSMLWTKRHGPIVKGCFGPWRGLFGNKNTFEDVVILNYCGLVKIKHENHSGIIERIARRLLPLKSQPYRFVKSPSFCPIKVESHENKLVLIWQNDSAEYCYFNLPSISDEFVAELYVDNVRVPLTHIGNIRNQYNWAKIFQSKSFNGKEWKLIIGK